jgi:hypothetical protein
MIFPSSAGMSLTKLTGRLVSGKGPRTFFYSVVWRLTLLVIVLYIIVRSYGASILMFKSGRRMIINTRKGLCKKMRQCGIIP